MTTPKAYTAAGSADPAAPPPLLQVRNLTKSFSGSRSFLRPARRLVRAVDGVDLSVYEGETFGLVGESGCGKSTLGRLLVRLVEPTEGSVVFRGTDLATLKGEKLRQLRSEMQIVFQDPFGSLDPRYSVSRSIAEPLRAHGVSDRPRIKGRVSELLDMVGLPQSMAERLPHEMSGGQRQRVGIARAIALEPKFIVADEPVSALDVSVQAQILNLLMDLQNTLGLTYVFVAHGLNVVRHVSNRVAVMYLGRIMELAESERIFQSFTHPYTASLLSAVATLGEEGKQRLILKGEVGSAANLPSGCRFHPRCPIRQKICEEVQPELSEIEPGHWCACHFPLATGAERSKFFAGSIDTNSINIRR